MKKILFIIGTRPEAIKILPIYIFFKKYNKFDTKICVTAQHRKMLDDVMSFFGVKADYDLDLMRQNQTLDELTSKILLEVSSILDEFKPNLVFVHGDTTTSFVASLASFYKKIDVAHVEAGLRTYDIYSPFPEEVNRQLTSKIAKYHFAPTLLAKQNLLRENIDEDNIFVVGNSVIDALFFTIDRLKNTTPCLDYTPSERKFVLITGHRRENFGDNFLNICSSIKELAFKYSDMDFVYPLHLNPNICEPAKKILSDIKNVYLIEPLEYESFVCLMSKAYIILTDSGGIQEEAPSFGKPVLVMRNNTERPEAVEAGTVRLVGTTRIVDEVCKLVENVDEYNKFKNLKNPYGDGKTSSKIYEIIESLL